MTDDESRRQRIPLPSSPSPGRFRLLDDSNASPADQADLGTGTFDDVEGVLGILSDGRLPFEQVGCHRVSRARQLLLAPDRCWVTGPKIQLSLNHTLIRRIAETGCRVDLAQARAFYAAPLQWDPADHMTSSRSGLTVVGVLPDTTPMLALPFGTDASGLAYWIAIDIRREPRWGGDAE